MGQAYYEWVNANCDPRDEPSVLTSELWDERRGITQEIESIDDWCEELSAELSTATEPVVATDQNRSVNQSNGQEQISGSGG